MTKINKTYYVVNSMVDQHDIKSRLTYVAESVESFNTLVNVWDFKKSTFPLILGKECSVIFKITNIKLKKDLLFS